MCLERSADCRRGALPSREPGPPALAKASDGWAVREMSFLLSSSTPLIITMVPARLSTGTQSALRRSVVNVNSSAPAVARLTATPRFAAPSLYAAAPRTTPFTSAAPVHRFLHTTHPRSLRDDSGKAPTDWAGKGPISYDELKPITEAPTGVSRRSSFVHPAYHPLTSRLLPAGCDHHRRS